MPVYEYRCSTCRTTFEKLVALRDATTSVPCPDCGKRAGKVLSTFAAIGGDKTSASATSASGGCCGGSCSCGR